MELAGVQLSGVESLEWNSKSLLERRSLSFVIVVLCLNCANCYHSYSSRLMQVQ